MAPAAARGEKRGRPPRAPADVEVRVKREFVEAVLAEERRGSPDDDGAGSSAAGASQGGDGAGASAASQGTPDRRAIRSRYLAVKSLISDDRDDLSSVQSDRFSTIFTEVESLYKLVQKPREQVADAEALLDIAGTLVTSVRSYNNDGVTPSDFITALLDKFGQHNVASSSSQPSGRTVVSWTDLGTSMANLFNNAVGCSTMYLFWDPDLYYSVSDLYVCFFYGNVVEFWSFSSYRIHNFINCRLGPMSLEVKPRRVVAPRRRRTDAAKARPEELEETAAEKKDTDKNMLTMFEILRKHRTVRLENLVLNRNSFAQTVENIFALSFLVKDGRVEISVKENGLHMISPRNAPPAASVTDGNVTFTHFVFRFDFRDWKLMCQTTPAGDELMPHRTEQNSSASSSQAHNVPYTQSAIPNADNVSSSQTHNVFSSEPESAHNDSQSSLPTTPIRKFSRHRGLVVQDQVVADSPESDDFESHALKRKTRRLFRG